MLFKTISFGWNHDPARNAASLYSVSYLPNLLSRKSKQHNEDFTASNLNISIVQRTEMTTLKTFLNFQPHFKNSSRINCRTLHWILLAGMFIFCSRLQLHADA